MVKKLLLFLAYSTFFIVALMAFFPKENIYFLLEKELKNFDVVISKEHVDSSLLSLNLQNLEITTKGIESALIDEASVTLLVFSNSIKLGNIKLSSLVEAYLPSRIDELEVTYTVFDPLHLNAVGMGAFGEAEASFNISSRELEVILKPSKKMLSKYRNSLRRFKKSENGEYVYVQSF